MSDAPTIVTCFPITPAQLETVRTTVAPEFEVLDASQDSINDDIFKADIFFGHAKKAPIDWAGVVEQGRLKWIQSSAAGLDHCLSPEVIACDQIVVSGCSGLFAPQVAETSMALLMGLLRSLPVFFEAKAKREYVRRFTDEIFGKTVGIVGYGGNGQQIAKTLSPMAGKILATDKFPDATVTNGFEGFAHTVYSDSQLHEMLPQCDVVIATLPLSDENEQLLSVKEFGLMKKGSYFINVGRGSVVDQNALIAAIESEHLAGVGIDVASPEPIEQDSKLWQFPNVIITPHIGAQSVHRVPRTIDLFCKNFQRYVGGETLINLVEKQLGYPLPKDRFDMQF
ncbi:D-2-hydroxyacid dehydrogenase [Mariniblastus fucicola]|uniref:2-hydroxyacid dehydrogenase n=1 Tax=Mariniblastus fucicola TaxID=980251 RepID=A0A5B9P8X0_9BACT|nr:D-2-hydroxyacid dehydrogenase [Mariniblastus fucicola]QEG23187.1 Putative 2-hydroxyacid dehydrogenase [Mariniblastus fucicola]